MNAFVQAFNARHIDSEAAKQKCTSNKRKIEILLARLQQESVLACFAKSELDADILDCALYVTEKLIAFHDFLASKDFRKLDDKMQAAFDTVIKCVRFEENLTYHDVFYSICMTDYVLEKKKSVLKYNADRAHLIAHNSNKITSAAQVDQCMQILRDAKVIKEISANVYKVNKSNALLQQYVKATSADMSKLELTASATDSSNS